MPITHIHIHHAPTDDYGVPGMQKGVHKNSAANPLAPRTTHIKYHEAAMTEHRNAAREQIRLNGGKSSPESKAHTQAGNLHFLAHQASQSGNHELAAEQAHMAHRHEAAHGIHLIK